MGKIKENLFDVYYSDTKGNHLKVRYCYIDSIQSKRFSIQNVGKVI